ncbi:MAG: M48 family metallopeptidase [Thiobacillus sp.]|nr:M48 family metallopeptidase [Thiobacillus sp.]
MAAVMCFTISAHALDLPDLGEVSRTSLTESNEDRIGREIMRQIRDSGDYYDDPVILEYLTGLGERLGSASPEPGMRFEFFAVRDPTLNAFALPGGYIGVHTGLISATRNESELAGVLGHELGHVTQKHIARMVDNQKNASLVSILALAVAILAARSNSDVTQAAIATSQAYSIQNQLNFTRENEREADRVGLQTLASAGYSPQGMSSFFERLQAQGRLYENNAPGYLRTHPLTYERIADMQNRLSQMRYQQREDSLEYLFVRARVQAEEGEARDALSRFEARVKEQGDAGNWYGLARAALRANELVRARAALQALAPYEDRSPLVPLLQGEILLAENRAGEAVQALEAAARRFSSYRPLAYLHARALLLAQRPAEAIALIRRQQQIWAADIRFLTLSAEAHQALGQWAQGHLAQAEAYVLQGRESAAIDQLQQAQKHRNSDFYTLSIIDARLRELKEQQSKEK